MSTHNIGVYEDLTKIIFQLSSNALLISSSGLDSSFQFCCQGPAAQLLRLFSAFVFNYLDSRVSLVVSKSSFEIKNFKPVNSLCSCAGQFLSYPVRNS